MMLVTVGPFLPFWGVVLMAGMLAQSECLAVAALRLLPPPRRQAAGLLSLLDGRGESGSSRAAGGLESASGERYATEQLAAQSPI